MGGYCRDSFWHSPAIGLAVLGSFSEVRLFVVRSGDEKGLGFH